MKGKSLYKHTISELNSEIAYPLFKNIISLLPCILKFHYSFLPCIIKSKIYVMYYCIETIRMESDSKQKTTNCKRSKTSWKTLFYQTIRK